MERKQESTEFEAEIAAIKAPRTILLVDDENDARFITKMFLANFGFVVHSFSSAEEALSHFDSQVHDLVVTDNAMAGVTGEELAHVIKMRSPSTPVVMYSGSRPADCSCVDSIVAKPSALVMLKEAVDKLLARPN